MRRPSDHSSRLARGELANEDATERLAAEHPDEHMRRREFLTRTATLAGAAGLATVLPPDTLVAEAARHAGREHLPSPRNLPLDTIVVLMMENRSFDHYFGWHRKADGRYKGLSYVDGAGNSVDTHRLPPDFQGCGHPDPDHSWDGGRFQYNGGKLDGFAKGSADGTGSDEFAVGYYLKDDLGFIPHVADAYTLYDRYFCSIMASTYPNRHYQLGAQSGGQKANDIPATTLGNQWETILDRAKSKGVSVGYYVADLPFPALYGTRGLSWVRPVSQFYLDARLGKLPQVCFVDPPFRDGGGGDGTSADEHPHGDIRLGQAFMSDIVHSFIESPQYRRGALFVNYDEWGGFFEHVRPRRVPDDRASQDLSEDFGLTGFRTPTVAISPFTRGGRVSHATLTHESVLKLISYRFGLGHLNKRHRYASNIGRTFKFSKPKLDPPQLPDPVAIAAIPCTLGGGSLGATRPKAHDMAKLETSGYLDRLGYEVKDASFDQIFRNPDSVSRALRKSTRTP